MLPRRNQDEQAGELRVTAYVTLLAGQTDEALGFMVREACKRFNWFPTAKQMLDILAEYRPPRSEQAQALLECENFADRMFATWLENLKQGQPVGDVPDQWKRIAEERGHMRRLADGSFVSRALYHGPVKPYVAPVREVTSYIHVAAPALPDVDQAEAA
ncbi:MULTISPECIES: hypothetical protein [unclassified Sphingomonas]|nr:MULTISPECIES: hypothetical protein [unclassified Sphingomonas]